ncbi:hypothetical protein RvY_05329 [Ramazzottius varieornatus]|uniref:F-box domain-containing protein n=1 Tax=Ramazzottius varieornatus TaxID=947166 RepID=A0A1D1V1C4_RAMVA|nr:hypothetical protein RvY_05329 [Ramazzottius varieornatus]
MNYLELLPWDIQADIFLRLDPADRASLRQACRHMRQLMDDPTFWRHQMVRLSSIRRFREPLWRLIRQRNIRHVEVHPTAKDLSQDAASHRHNLVWNDLQWDELAENIPLLETITTPLKCDKNKGLPEGMRSLEHLEVLNVHSILYADDRLFCDISQLSSLRKLSVEILCVDVIVERTDALRQLARLPNLEELSLSFRRYVLLPMSKLALQHLLYHLPKLRRFALRKCSFRFPDISGMFIAPPVLEDSPPMPERDPNVRSNFAQLTVEEGASGESEKPERISRLNLEELDLSGTLHHVLNEEAIAALQSLQIFRLQTHGIDELLESFLTSCLTKWANLRELDLRNATAPAEVFQHVPLSLRIIHLNLTEIEFGLSIEALLKLSERCGTTLTDLHLYGCTNLNKIGNLPDWFPNLHRLSLHGDLELITRDILCRLSEMEFLQELDVRECKVQPGKDVWQILASLMGPKTRIVIESEPQT